MLRCELKNNIANFYWASITTNGQDYRQIAYLDCDISVLCVYRLPDVASFGVQWHKMCIYTDKFIVVCNERGKWIIEYMLL